MSDDLLLHDADDLSLGIHLPDRDNAALDSAVHILIPLRYFLVIVRGIFRRDPASEVLWPQAIAPLAAMLSGADAGRYGDRRNHLKVDAAGGACPSSSMRLILTTGQRIDHDVYLWRCRSADVGADEEQVIGPDDIAKLLDNAKNPEELRETIPVDNRR